MAAVVPSRLAVLNRLRCEIFQTSYNPTSVRTGAKYLRARLRGPSMVQYYPEELTVAKFNRMPGAFKIQDWAEYQRLADVEEKKRRGKGAPKKAKTQGSRCVWFRASPSCSLCFSRQSEDVSQAVVCTLHASPSTSYIHFILMPHHRVPLCLKSAHCHLESMATLLSEEPQSFAPRHTLAMNAIAQATNVRLHRTAYSLICRPAEIFGCQ